MNAGSYLTIRVRDDGGPLSLTDDGGHVWLEDAAGIQRYDETIIEYPSASSVTKVGWSWAVNSQGAWQWTATPQPQGANNFTTDSPGMGGGGALSACPAGKYRNPETNRCRTVEEALNALAACDEGSERNPDTNRCRKVASLASATLTPCDPGQERNLETNRCRTIASKTVSTATPCKEGQERNPETNRCRKIQGASTSSIVDPPAKQGINAIGGIALGVVGLAAVGYGVYEWRNEFAAAFGRLIAALGKK